MREGPPVLHPGALQLQVGNHVEPGGLLWTRMRGMWRFGPATGQVY
jgi:hypothetical protein